MEKKNKNVFDAAFLAMKRWKLKKIQMGKSESCLTMAKNPVFLRLTMVRRKKNSLKFPLEGDQKCRF